MLIKMNRFSQFFTLGALVITCTILNAEAKLVQILHTNDTHSFLDSTTHTTELGGSARLKSLIDFYRAKGDEEGLTNLVIDAGDFMEGNLYYMADKGRKSFEVHNQMGYEMVALGNHDYMMGAPEFDKLLGEVDLNFSLLAANLEISSDYPNIRKKIQPYKEIEIDGIKVAVLGLTTNEVFYTWGFKKNRITSPYKAAEKYENILKKRKNDFIIALTHIGVGNDQRLARRTHNIDLFVGGHSHTALKEVLFEKNKNRTIVPIVQAGMHTEYLGRLVVDLVKGKPLKVISYNLIPVKYESADSDIKTLVEEAEVNLDELYGSKWLNKKIGYSDLKKDDPSGSRKWAYFIADALKEKAGTDVAIHVPPMNGENYPVGTITRRSIMNSIPRVFEVSEINGWSIYTAKIKGIWLKTIFETLTNFGEPLAFSGIEMAYIRTPFGIKIKNAKINGKNISPFKEYTVAFTEGIIRGALAVSSKTKILLKDPKGLDFKIWQTLMDKVSTQSAKIKTMNEVDRTFYYPDQESLDKKIE